MLDDRTVRAGMWGRQCPGVLEMRDNYMIWEGVARRRRVESSNKYRQEAGVMTQGLASYPKEPGLPIF